MTRNYWEDASSPPSVWLGSIAPEPRGELLWGPSASEKLRDAVITERRPFVLVGRNSNSSGWRGCEAAAIDLHEAAERLAEMGGFDVRPVLPGISELAAALFSGGQVQASTTRGGVRFMNRYMLVDLQSVGLVLSLSAGTSVKLGEDLLQPHAKFLARVMDEVDPTISGMFAKRIDRITRAKNGHVPLYNVLDHHHNMGLYLWVADGTVGRWRFEVSGFTGILTMQADNAAQEAENLRRKREQGMRRTTDVSMVDGKVDCGRGNLCPPGFFRYRDRARRRSVLAVDTPSNYPPAERSQTLLPDVRDAWGAPADQVELVREALLALALGGVAFVDTFVSLAERGLSTDYLRRKHGSSARFLAPDLPAGRPVADQARMFARRLERLMDVYEFGVAELNLDDEPVEVRGLMPTDGKPWAPGDSFAAIRETLQGFRAQRWRQPAQHTYSWSGMPVRLNGSPAVMRPAPRTARQVAMDGPGLDWQVQENAPRNQLAGYRRPRIPDAVFTKSLVDALLDADGSVLRAYLTSEQRAGESDLAGERRILATRVEEARASQRRIADALSRLDERSSRASSSGDALLDKMLELDQRVEAAEAAIAALDRRVASRRPPAGVSPSELALLVRGLRDPHANGYRELLRRAVRELEFSETPLRRGPRTGVQASWAGTLALACPGPGLDSTLVELPFSGQVVLGNILNEQERAVKAIELLRAGEVARNSAGPLRHSMAIAAEHLGAKGRFLPGYCAHPTLLRMWMAIMFPEAAKGEATPVPAIEDIVADPVVAATFGGDEPVRRLVERMRAIAVDRPRTWQVPRGDMETKAILRSSVHKRLARERGEEGVEAPLLSGDELSDSAKLRIVVKQGARTHRWVWRRGCMPVFTPCEFCGGDIATLVRFREVSGYLCLGCHRDEAGVTWNSGFDSYLAGWELLRDAGVDLTLPDGFDGDVDRVRGSAASVAERSPRFWRVWDGLTAEERVAVAAEYAAGDLLADICDRHRIAKSSVVRCVDDAGVPRRRPDLGPPTSLQSGSI